MLQIFEDVAHVLSKQIVFLPLSEAPLSPESPCEDCNAAIMNNSLTANNDHIDD